MDLPKVNVDGGGLGAAPKLAEVLERLASREGFPAGGRVLAAMSGGIDSSVAAALLRSAGVDVVGVSMRLFDRATADLGQDSEGSCCSLDDFQDARKVAQQFGFPHFVMDLESRFREDVIQPFVQAYRSGLTPNPCVNCNKSLKFDALLERARAVGASHVVTGHYARIRTEDGDHALLRASDPEKDQSYFLYHLNQNSMSKTLFPLGDYSKAQVRDLARQLGLHVAGKSESQDICFIPNGRYDQFLAREAADLEDGAGEIRHIDGRLLGHHHGHWTFTVGQRRGIRIAAPEPLYVVRVSPGTHTVWVGAEADLGRTVLTALEVNWCGERPATALPCQVKIRSRSAAAAALVTPCGLDRAEVVFEAPQRAVAPGQAAVFYQGEWVLGGGWIAADPPPAQG